MQDRTINNALLALRKQDRTINNALLALRKQIIRGNGTGLEHVEALLRARYVRLPKLRCPRRSDAARQGVLHNLVMEALQDGPQPLQAIVAYVVNKRPEAAERAYNRTAQTLHRLQGKGLVRREGRAWLLPALTEDIGKCGACNRQ